MANSPRMLWPYPSEGVDPWYDSFEALVNASDSSAFASYEDRNLVVYGGGNFSFNASTETLTWSSNIGIAFPATGLSQTVITTPRSVTLQDGQIAYVSITRGATQAVNLYLATAFTLPTSGKDAQLVLFQRVGARVYFRNGAILQDGSTAAVFEQGSSGGGGTLNAQYRAVSLGSVTTINIAGAAAISGQLVGSTAVYTFSAGAEPATVSSTPYTISLLSAQRAFYVVGIGANSTINLPLASTADGQFFYFKNLLSGFYVDIQRIGSDTIDGATYVRLNSQYDFVTLHAAGGSWNVVARSESGAGTVTSITAGTGLSGGTITTTGTVALANTAVTPGAYSNANITVDAQGRITLASNGGAITSVGASSPLSSSGGTTPSISLSGTVPVANGGTGVASLATNSVMLGGATVGTVSPGASGTVLTSDGTTWSAVAPTVPTYSVNSALIGSAFNTNFISGGLSASLAAGTVTFTQLPAALTAPINATPYTINTASPARFFAIVGPAASNVVVNLPAANTVEDQFFYFKSFLVSGYSVSLTPNGADTIDGSASAFVFNQQYDSVLLESSSLGWSVVAAYLGTRTVQTFTSSGTWTKPANAKVVRVVAIGSGGGGGSGACGDNSVNRSGGGGGGAGAVSDETFAASDVPATLTVTVGAAGGGGGGVVGGFSGNPGSPGGATLVSDGATFYIQAAGGAGGGGGTTTSGTAGAAGTTGYYTGTNGAAGSTGSPASAANSIRGCTGGGGGGGVTTIGGWGVGSNSGIPNLVLNYTNLQALGGTSIGGAGQVGISITVAAATIGSGGGGGAGNNTGAGNGGAGGFGGAAGGGGGGGGAARDSGYPPFNHLSGTGGVGGRGEVRIYTW